MTACIVVGLTDLPTRAEVARGEVALDWVPRATIVQAVHRATQAARCTHQHAEGGQVLVVYREALERLATACTRNITGQAGSCPHPQGGGQALARERWCTACIAADALATAEGLRSS